MFAMLIVRFSPPIGLCFVNVLQNIRFFAFLLASFLGLTALHAQSFRSAALDSDCYFPVLGDPAELDTICGSVAGQGLGRFVKNLGLLPDGRSGRMFLSNLDPELGDQGPWDRVPTGPVFDLHHLEASLQKFPSRGTVPNFTLAHFRNRAYLDVFVPETWRIYWADTLGNYDTTRYTQLSSHLKGDREWYMKIFGFGNSEAYVAPMTDDTLSDVVVALYTDWTDASKDTAFLLLFRSTSLHGQDTAFEDTSCVLFPTVKNNPYRNIFQGDFRGSGRDDLVIYTQAVQGWPGTNNNDFFYFRNDPPFSLTRLATAIVSDTLMAAWQIFDSLSTPSVPDFRVEFSMRALPKSIDDRSQDWMPVFPTISHPDNEILIFRGGPDFGTHRLTLDSAAFRIPPPGTYDNAAFGGLVWPDGLGLADAGDMTGTGNRVLYVPAADAAGDFWQEMFYVTGAALDDKIDMYQGPAPGSAFGDTLTANGDRREDWLSGRPGMVAPNGRSSGSLWLYYGSSKIPVHTKTDGITNPQAEQSGLAFSPNPAIRWSVVTVDWPVAEEVQFEIRNVLGNLVQEGTLRMRGGPEQQRIYFNDLSPGVYYVTIHGAHTERRGTLAILR